MAESYPDSNRENTINVNRSAQGSLSLIEEIISSLWALWRQNKDWIAAHPEQTEENKVRRKRMDKIEKLVPYLMDIKKDRGFFSTHKGGSVGPYKLAEKFKDAGIHCTDIAGSSQRDDAQGKLPRGEAYKLFVVKALRGEPRSAKEKPYQDFFLKKYFDAHVAKNAEPTFGKAVILANQYKELQKYELQTKIYSISVKLSVPGQKNKRKNNIFYAKLSDMREIAASALPEPRADQELRDDCFSDIDGWKTAMTFRARLINAFKKTALFERDEQSEEELRKRLQDAKLYGVTIKFD